MKLTAVIAAAGALLCSCSSLIVTPDGCILAKRDGIAVGWCQDKTIVARGTAADGTKLEARYNTDTDTWALRYQAADGVWVAYDSKSGLFDFGSLIAAVEAEAPNAGD